MRRALLPRGCLSSQQNISVTKYLRFYCHNRSLTYYTCPSQIQWLQQPQLCRTALRRLNSSSSLLFSLQYSNRTTAASGGGQYYHWGQQFRCLSGDQSQAPQTQQPATTGQSEVAAAKPEKKPPLATRIWHELVHYWNGFRLLLLEIRIASRIGFKYLRGKPISRRERRHFVRTVADIFRMLPFIVFIVVPFMELLLPLYLKFMPFMLPSTFQAKDKEAENMRVRLKAKLETAKFLQATLHEGFHLKDGAKSEVRQSLEEFRNFVDKCSTAGRYATTDELLRFSRLFADELTLDSLDRSQLAAICKLLEVSAVGPKALIELQLEIRLRRLHADDQLIQSEGLDKLNVAELQAACRARGMRSLGMSEERLKQQLTQWLDLHLNSKVPTSLLLLSRSLHFPDHLEPEDLLRKTIAALPQQTVVSVVASTGADNKAKLEALKSADKAIVKEAEEASSVAPADGVGSSDLKQLESAIHQLAGDRLLKGQELRDLKESAAAVAAAASASAAAAAAAAAAAGEATALQGDAAAKPPAKTSKAAVLLDAKLGRLVGEIDSMMQKVQIEREALERRLKEDLEGDASGQIKEQLLSLNDLQLALKKFQRNPDDDRWEKILPLLDEDNDGQIEIHHVTQVTEMLGSDNSRLSSADLAKLLEALDKERLIQMSSKDTTGAGRGSGESLTKKIQ